MGKNKLRKFAELENNPLVLQYPYGVVKADGFPLRGNWRRDFFRNGNPVVLELGCGKGEYTVGLGRRFPDKNFIGIDIKGARIWSGATEAMREGMNNVAFVRTSIELLEYFFAPSEVDEIWITFPDPQMKKVTKRLTGTRFLGLYRQVMKDGGVINLKSDSPFLYTYTRLMTQLNGFEVITDTADLYNDATVDGDILGIRTFYEQQWLDRGLTIKYIAWKLDRETPLQEPDVEIEHDTYRSFSRGELQCPELCNNPEVRPKGSQSEK